MQARDAQDAARAAAPLRPAADAMMLDTTLLEPDEAFAARWRAGGAAAGELRLRVDRFTDAFVDRECVLLDSAPRFVLLRRTTR